MAYTLPGGYNDINELIDLYKKSNADVILIEGAIGQMNEHTVLPLLKEHMEFSQKDKILLFSCEDERSSELMPLYLWDYLAIIKPRNIRPVIKKEYNYSDGREVLHGLRMELEQSHVDQAYKKLRRLFEDTSIAEGYVMTRSIVLAYIYQVSNMERALECLAQGELYLFGKHQQLQEQIQKNITSFPNDFSTSLMKYAVGE